MDKIRRVHLEEKTGFRKWISRRYYDRPDGEDILGKLSYTTKMAAVGGSVCGYVYAMYPPPPVLNTRMKLLRMAQVLVPSIGMAVAFTCVTYYATNYREKDDPLNYVFGGAAAGLILGPATGMGGMSVLGALVLGTVGYAKKAAQLSGSRLVPKIKQKEFSSYIIKTWDTTLMKEAAKGNWVKESPTH